MELCETALEFSKMETALTAKKAAIELARRGPGAANLSRSQSVSSSAPSSSDASPNPKRARTTQASPTKKGWSTPKPEVWHTNVVQFLLRKIPSDAKLDGSKTLEGRVRTLIALGGPFTKKVNLNTLVNMYSNPISWWLVTNNPEDYECMRPALAKHWRQVIPWANDVDDALVLMVMMNYPNNEPKISLKQAIAWDEDLRKDSLRVFTVWPDRDVTPAPVATAEAEASSAVPLIPDSPRSYLKLTKQVVEEVVEVAVEEAVEEFSAGAGAACAAGAGGAGGGGGSAAGADAYRALPAVVHENRAAWLAAGFGKSVEIAEAMEPVSAIASSEPASSSGHVEQVLADEQQTATGDEPTIPVPLVVDPF